MSNIFLIADTHFNDNKVIKYENRPFSNAENMNKQLILNWNSIVTDNDTVFVLGDFAILIPNHNLANITKQLKGHKNLILGNHDNATIKDYYDFGFEKVYDYPILFENFYILSHYPIYINENMPYANIFGHVHNCPTYKTVTQQSYCVSAERINYTPITFSKVQQAILNYIQ